MDSNSNNTILATTFDPKSRSSLLISSSSSSSPFTSLLSEDGAGCNAEETRCLMRLIDEYNNSRTSNEHHTSLIHSSSNSRSLSKAYRTHIVECIEQWEQRIFDTHDADVATSNTSTNNIKDDNTKKIDQEIKDKDLLKLSHAITHLAEIYLCGGNENEGFGDEDFDLQLSSGMSRTNQNDMGIVTTDTIRYLRYHHLEGIDSYIENILEEVTIEELMGSNQPEHYMPDNQLSSMTNLTPYWALVRKLVQRGLLKDAWNVLRTHSACVRAAQKFATLTEHRSNSGRNSFIDQTIQEDIEAFALIEKLLSFAPIPGGRTERNDSGLGGTDDDDDDEEECEEGEAKEDWWNGIEITAYKLWENYNDSEGNSPNSVQDAPLEFNIYAVMNIYNSWKMAVSQSLKSNAALRNLTRRIPNLQTCVWDILLDTQESFINGEDSWAERLLAELLYVRPNIRKEDISVRACAHMKQCGIMTDTYNSQQQMEDIVIEVMKGNAGTIIEALHSFGGASGAALPATMTALLCSLLVKNGQIRLSDLSYDILTEKLLSASSAIISSFAIQNHTDVGIRLATKLLQTYITPENMQITSHVADMLSRHWPKSDAEVQGLLTTCIDGVERGSFRMLDACESLSFTRYLFHKQKATLESSVYWLLRGIECASKLGADGNEDELRTDITRSMCFRQLTRTCVDMSSEVLQALLKNTSISSTSIPQLLHMIKEVKDVQGVIMDDDISDLIASDPSVSLLVCVADIAWNIFERNDKEVANAIIHCLEERKDMDGSVIILSSPGLYGYFLSLAYDILSAENGPVGDLTDLSVSFDVHGMQVLLSCFHCHCNADKYGSSSINNLRDGITFDKMRVALGKGLMRAFIAQNSQVGKGKTVSNAKKVEPTVNMDQLLGPSM